MSAAPVIQVDGLGKRYALGEREPYQTLRDVAPRVLRRATGRERPRPEAHVWALRNATFEVRDGEVLGVIGPNGAGKTTLLKLLSRITEPTEGRAVIHGRVGSLLEVGTGFHPELTGRENVAMYGAILGMSRRETRDRFDAIVAFAGVEEFLDTPVKRYSTGMRVRLAFSVVAHLEPEVLLVDEVLAVGDARFQEKCLGKMGEVARNDRTVFFVSHNMAMIRAVCSRAIVLDHGGVRFDGDVADAVHHYLSSVTTVPPGEDLRGRKDRGGHGSTRLLRCQVRGPRGTVCTGAPAEFWFDYETIPEHRMIPRLHVTVAITDAFGVNIFACNSMMNPEGDLFDAPPQGRVVVRLPRLPLIPGMYHMNVSLKDDRGIADVVDRCGSFSVLDGGDYDGMTFFLPRSFGSVVVPHTWEVGPPSDPVPAEAMPR